MIHLNPSSLPAAINRKFIKRNLCQGRSAPVFSWFGRTLWEKKKFQINKEEESDKEGAEKDSIHRLETCRVMRQRLRREVIMKGEAFGFSGDCHDPGFGRLVGLAFPAEAGIHLSLSRSLPAPSDGSPPTTAGMTEEEARMTDETRWIPAYYCGDDRRRVG